MDCKTCMNYVDVAGLYKDSPTGLCMIPDRHARKVNPENGLNCQEWRPRDIPVAANVGELPSVPKADPYPIQPSPVSLKQQPVSEKAISVNDILKISYKGEWIVSAIGKMAILAANPQTNEEMAFPDAKFQFEMLRK